MRYFPILLLFVVALTGCYKETDVAPDLYTSAGEVPQVAVFWAGPTRGTTTVTVDASSSVPVVIEYTSAVDVKEIKLYTRPTATGTLTPLTTLPVTAATYDATLRNFVVRTNYTAPTARNSSIQVVAEVVGVNNLTSALRAVTVRTRA
jgi:hypothetical protein